MKMAPAHFRSEAAFNRLELLLVISAVVLLGAMALTYQAQRRPKVQRMQCVRNLNQVGIGFRLSANDSEPHYPEYVATNQAWQYFQEIGSEIGSPKVLLCPADARAESENPAVNFETYGRPGSFAHPDNRNRQLSYFYGPDADEVYPGRILAGDYNFSTNREVLSGVLHLQTNSPAVQWTETMHRDKGNIVLADGSIQTIASAQLQAHLRAEAFRTGPTGTSNLLNTLHFFLPGPPP